MIRLPAAPLVERVEAVGGVHRLAAAAPAPKTLVRQYERVAAAGEATVWAADRLAVHLLGLHPALVWDGWWDLPDAPAPRPPRKRRRRQASTCQVDGCDRRDVVSRDMCAKHYSRWQRHGDPRKTERVMDGGSPHGGRARYNQGCRCGPCRRAQRDYDRRRYRASDQRREQLKAASHRWWQAHRKDRP